MFYLAGKHQDDSETHTVCGITPAVKEPIIYFGDIFGELKLFHLINDFYYTSARNGGKHYDFNMDKVYNSLRIPVLIDTCAMKH